MKKTILTIFILLLSTSAWAGVATDQEGYIGEDLTVVGNVEAGTVMEYLTKNTDVGDEGIDCSGEFHIGRPGAGKEVVIGEGDSYPVGKESGTQTTGSAWHCDIANTTGLTITSATDVTTELASGTGSTSTLFGGTTTGKYILVGSDVKFAGVKASIDTLATVEPDNIIGEYLTDSGGVWTYAPIMVTDSNFPYDQRGDSIASCSSCSEQWRFGFDPRENPPEWSQVTLNINGTDYTKYWGRYRVTSAITSDPIIEQIKLHTNRFEANSDGSTEYFGRARYPVSVPIEFHQNADKAPANQDISISADFTEDRSTNQFSDNAEDGFILSGVVPVGLDTSILVQVIIDWYPEGTGSGNVELELETVVAKEGFVYDGTATPTAAAPIIVSINNQEGELQRSTFYLDISGTLPTDKVYGSLFRDATGGNADDTYANPIVITGYQVVGYSWRP